MVIFGYHWSIHTSSDRHHRPLARGIWIPVGWPMTHVPSATDLTARGQVRRHAVSRSPVRARTTADLPGSWARMPRGDSAPPWKGLHVPHIRGATVEGGVLMSDTAHGCRRRHKPRIAGLVFMLHEHGRRCRVPFSVYFEGLPPALATAEASEDTCPPAVSSTEGARGGMGSPLQPPPRALNSVRRLFCRARCMAMRFCRATAYERWASILSR